MIKPTRLIDLLRGTRNLVMTNKGLTVLGVAGAVGGISLIRGLRLKKEEGRSRTEQLKMFKQHPAFWMYDRRKGSHLFGEALIQRDWELLGG